MVNNLQQPKIHTQVEGAFPLLDYVQFLKSGWKVMAIFGLSGIGLATLFIIFTPKQYEAVSKIGMAQMGTFGNGGLDITGTIIEEPQLLILRLSSPTSYTPQVINDCGFQDKKNGALVLSKSVKLTIPKGVAGLVELKTYGSTPQVAKECNLALFEFIKASQSKIAQPFIEQAKVRLADDKERLANAKGLMAKADKSSAAMSAAYLSFRDEVSHLLGEISTLEYIINSNQNRVTHLVNAVYVNDDAVTPNKRIILIAGFLGGILSGLLLALIRRIIVTVKSEGGGHYGGVES
jgi:hypothetical protein